MLYYVMQARRAAALAGLNRHEAAAEAFDAAAACCADECVGSYGELAAAQRVAEQEMRAKEEEKRAATVETASRRREVR